MGDHHAGGANHGPAAGSIPTAGPDLFCPNYFLRCTNLLCSTKLWSTKLCSTKLWSTKLWKPNGWKCHWRRIRRIRRIWRILSLIDQTSSRKGAAEQVSFFCPPPVWVWCQTQLTGQQFFVLLLVWIES